MRRSDACALLLILLPSVAGCGKGDSSRAGPLVRDSAGVRIVENRAPRWDEASSWRVGAEPVLEIGAVFGADPALEFSRISDVVRLGDGRIAVLEGQTSEIRYFSAQGRHLATRGGRGGGPGEFRSAARMLRLAGDTLLVEDRPRIAQLFFAPDGDYVRREAMDADRYAALAPWAECGGGSLPDRSLLLCRREGDARGHEGDPGPGHLRSFARYVRTSLALDTLVALGMYGGIEQWGVSVGGSTRFAIHPFHSRTALAYGGSPLRIAIAINPQYSIEVWTPDGRLERIIRRRDGRRAASAEERALALEQLSIFPPDDALRSRFLSEMQVPDSLPAVSSLVIDATNHLWVQVPALSPASAHTFDVFGADGTLLGGIELPARFTPYEIGDDYVLGVFRDEHDVPFVRMYGLHRERRGG